MTENIYDMFKPDLTPAQIFRAGAFDGTYFRPIYSRVTNKSYKNQHKKYTFLKNIPEYKLTRSLDHADININKYKVHVGTTLEFWEDSGWIRPSHPYGWVQWYCDYYSGKRCDDDERQIKRWIAINRFRKRLITMIKNKAASLPLPKDKALKKALDDYTISPKIRQTLLHWAYQLTIDDLL